MQNLLSLWSGFDLRRRIILVVATIAMFAAVLALSRFVTTPRMELLYAGLDQASAGEVIAALEQRGATYEVRGGSIYTEAAGRDELRLTLAAEGLPTAGAAGYELLDSLSGFGTTSQMFDAAYWRAKEGELARTILAMPQIKSARVHISRSDPQPFRKPDPQTASITVTSTSGSLPVERARALKHLVASAVAGMTPEDVAVIDSSGGLIEEAPPDSPGTIGGAKAIELKRNVERLLEARVGPGNAVVEVSVDVETERESITERRFDPDSRVAISTDTEEKSGNSTDPGGQVTVASNLPDGDVNADEGAKSSTSESRERVNFEVSETQREVLRTPGAIRRLSVAVLVNAVSAPAADGALAATPRPQEELDMLRDLVASAVGFDEKRGDAITLRSLAFEAPTSQGTLAAAGMMQDLPLLSLIQIAVLAIVALVIALFVLRPMLLGQRRAIADNNSFLSLPSGAGAAATGEATRVLHGEIDDRGDLPPLSVVSRDDQAIGEIPDPVTRLRRLIEQRQAESVEILRGWMEDREEKV
ncbi:MAG: flagellar M-ring protein FliF [Cereibacter sphaeroides]|uniref:Flagellar M-ring protein n=1 Tax=Cereibacter sphaeroides TaxID=1063 RepID=A0A2W5S867_CERSP|nr:MAG: flagellar M-ring protein FliF [Cereibacter sphaeroides]